MVYTDPWDRAPAVHEHVWWCMSGRIGSWRDEDLVGGGNED